MVDKKAFVREVQAYLDRAVVIDRRTGRQLKPTQKLLLEKDPATLSRKMNDPETLTGKDVRAICFTLIYWGCITHRKRLLYLFDLGGYQLPEGDWSEEPWKYLIDDTKPLRVEVIRLQNASFENWKDDVPVKWLCNTKTGWVKPVAGREAKGGMALEVGGNRENREWVYCRTRETQEIPVEPGSRISLSFWAQKVKGQEGNHPERSKYVEVFFHDGIEWGWGFGQDVTSNDWLHYETEWWDVPTYVQKISIGAVVYKDGAFQVDDIELRMREGK